MELVQIVIGSIFVYNIVLFYFFGICPFIGVSTKLETAFGMGGAVTFVMVISSIITYLITNYHRINNIFLISKRAVIYDFDVLRL